MIKRILLAAFTLGAALIAPAQLVFTGSSGNTIPTVKVEAEASTGLEAIFVIEHMELSKASYTSQGGTVSIYRYSNLGGGYAETMPGIEHQGNTYSFTPGQSDLGIIIDDGNRRRCFWLVNYANHELDLEALNVSAESDCALTMLQLTGKAPAITYYTVNGRGVELSRDMDLLYSTLEFDQDAAMWRQRQAEKVISSTSGTISVEAPLCDTEFTLTGDRFLKAWGREQEISTDTYHTKAVSAVTTAQQVSREVDNEKKPAVDGLGGSAPCEITFTAHPTDAAIFHEWQMSIYEDFNDINDRFQNDELTYVFDDKGVTYVRYVCGDADGECFYYGDVYTVTVGESRLEIPNAFSPGNQDGVNDEWKVSYQSLVSFECHIFNRWGTKMATLTDPSQGWDGKYKGKLVPSGVYFYVIKAKGADGVQYNKSGDINILHSRTYQVSSAAD